MSGVPPVDPSGNPNPPASGGGNPEPTAPKPGDQVSYESHQRLLSEKKAEQEKRRQAEEELQKLKAEKEEREKKELTEQGKFKEALQKTEEELQKERLEKEGLLGSLREAAKKQAILREIPGLVPDRAHSLLPLDEISIGADGKPDPASVKAAAQKFEKECAFAIQKDTAGGGLPTDAPTGGNNKKLTVKEWKALPAAEMKKRHNEVDWSTA